MNTTDILPFNSDIDASYNVFGAVNSGTSTVFNDLVAAKAKITDGIDNAVTGYVNIQPLRAFVATLADLPNALKTVPEDFKIELKDDPAVYGATAFFTITKSHTIGVYKNPSPTITIATLDANAPNKEIKFNNPVSVSGGFLLNSKITPAAMFKINGSSTLSIAPSMSNFVNGKLTIENFTNSISYIPVGKGVIAGYLGLTNVAGSTSVFEIEYFSSTHSSSVKDAGLTSVSGNEYWTVNRISGTLSAQVRLYTFDLATSGLFPGTFSDVVVAKYSTGNSRWENLGASGNVTGTPNYVTANVVSSDFGDFTFGSNTQVLPINMISFTVQATIGGASVKWSTVKESNNVRFEIEKSLNGKDFLVVGTKAAANNAANGANYEFLDVNFTQSAYYRLVQVDVSGKRKTYNDLTKFVKGLDNSLAVNAYPNPVTTKLYVTLGSSAKENVKLLITDMSGKILKVKTADSSQAIELDVAGLASGSYILQVVKDSGNVSKKIIKL